MLKKDVLNKINIIKLKKDSWKKCDIKIIFLCEKEIKMNKMHLTEGFDKNCVCVTQHILDLFN